MVGNGVPYEFVVQSVRRELSGGCEHLITVKLGDGRMQTAAFAMGMIEQHDAHYDFCGARLRIASCRFCDDDAVLVVG